MNRTKRGILTLKHLAFSGVAMLAFSCFVSEAGAQTAAGPLNKDEALRAEKSNVAAELDNRESLLRQENLIAAEQKFEDALKALELEQHALAEDKLEEAQAKLKEAEKYAKAAGVNAQQAKELEEKVRDANAKLNMKWADYLVREAKANVDTGMIEDALNKLTKAKTMTTSDASKKKIDGMIKQLRLDQKDIEFKERTKTSTIILDKAEDDYLEAIDLERGRVFLQNGRYADARDTFETVILRNPRI